MTRAISSSTEAESLVGQVLGQSEPVLVDQARIDGFAAATGCDVYIAHTQQ